ncbi:hypothetical protein M1146_08125 [Patescibacteria group bacterium]|nr:hypothetical protein [Patescibacteria group bacterium]
MKVDGGRMEGVPGAFLPVIEALVVGTLLVKILETKSVSSRIHKSL